VTPSPDTNVKELQVHQEVRMSSLPTTPDGTDSVTRAPIPTARSADTVADRPLSTDASGQGAVLSGHGLPGDLREGYADIGDQRLHYVEAGEGPLIVLLHGFPEFWFGWRSQIASLAAAGFRVVAPDTRGYNLSSRPQDVAAYDTGLLAEDIRGLIQERGAETAMLVGHDWGGTLAWTLAMNHPEVVDRLVVLNAAHPRKLSQGLHHPAQLRRSWYFFFFDLPDLPETVVHANNWHFFRHFLRDARPALTPEETDRYVEAWSQPGAATGMINYYRSSVRTPPKKAEAAIQPIQAPTLVIWGEADHYLSPDLAEPDHDDVPNLDRVERLPDASHWVHHDEAERVTQLLIDFFAPALPARN
jgi:pimeloyl-ACP methyl ester carboxylesterase